MHLSSNVLFNIALVTERPYTLSSCDQDLRSMLSGEGFWKEKFAQDNLELPLFSYFGVFAWSSAYLTSKRSKEAVQNFTKNFKPFTILLWHVPEVRVLSFNNLPISLASAYLAKACKEYEIKGDLKSLQNFCRCYLKVEQEEVTFVIGEHKNKIKVDEKEMHRFLFHIDFLNIQKLSEL